jgi:hypothetical protein
VLPREWYDCASHRGDQNDLGNTLLVCFGCCMILLSSSKSRYATHVVCLWQVRLGWFAAVLVILQLVEDGLVMCGLPCSSYVFINLGTSKRSKENPFGNEVPVSSTHTL